MGAACTRHSLPPLISGGDGWQDPDTIRVAGMRTAVSEIVIASEEK